MPMPTLSPPEADKVLTVGTLPTIPTPAYSVGANGVVP